MGAGWGQIRNWLCDTPHVSGHLSVPERSDRATACSVVGGVARKAAALGKSGGVDDEGFLRWV
jgi:hypothetical protein